MVHKQSWIYLEGHMMGEDLDFWLNAIPGDTEEGLFAQCFLENPIPGA